MKRRLGQVPGGQENRGEQGAEISQEKDSDRLFRAFGEAWRGILFERSAAVPGAYYKKIGSYQYDHEDEPPVCMGNVLST